MTIGNRIVKLRKDLQLSQEDLAAKIGVTRQSVSKWETDACAPDAYNLMSLAEVLQTTVEYIVTGHAVATAKEPAIHTDKQEKEFSKWAVLGVGLMLLAGGIIMAIIGMFLDVTWCMIGGGIAILGIVLALVRKRKTLMIVLPIIAVLIVAVVLLLTV